MLGNAVKIFWFKIILPKVNENVEESRFCVWIRFRKFDEYTIVLKFQNTPLELMNILFPFNIRYNRI